MSIKIQGKTCLVLSHRNNHFHCDAVENELNISNKGEEKSIKILSKPFPVLSHRNYFQFLKFALKVSKELKTFLFEASLLK